MGGRSPANELPLGGSASVRPGKSPGLAVSSGMTTLDARPGRSPGLDLSKGATLGRRMKQGGSLGNDNGAPRNDGRERFELAEKRNNDLGSPRFARGGHAHKQTHKDLHSIYKILHHHFEGGSESEPQMASGGKMWIQGAINPKNKGALHRSLHVPQGQKIPASKLEKAEHSRNPTLRKRAQLAETLKGFHHRPRGR